MLRLGVQTNVSTAAWTDFVNRLLSVLLNS